MRRRRPRTTVSRASGANAGAPRNDSLSQLRNTGLGSVGQLPWCAQHHFGPATEVADIPSDAQMLSLQRRFRCAEFRPVMSVDHCGERTFRIWLIRVDDCEECGVGPRPDHIIGRRDDDAERRAESAHKSNAAEVITNFAEYIAFSGTGGRATCRARTYDSVKRVFGSVTGDGHNDDSAPVQVVSMVSSADCRLLFPR